MRFHVNSGRTLLAGVLGGGSLLSALLLGVGGPPSEGAMPGPAQSPEHTPGSPEATTAVPTPSPTPSGGDLLQGISDSPEEGEGRIPAFLRSGTPLQPGPSVQRSSTDPFEPPGRSGFLPGGMIPERLEEGPAQGSGARSRESQGIRLSEPGRRAPEGATRGDESIPLPGLRDLDLPDDSPSEEPPPPGRARLRAGSIPVERLLWLDGVPVSSFQLTGMVFTPGQHTIRLEGAGKCVQFVVRLLPDEITYMIWDFEAEDWKRAVRVGASGRAPNPVPVGPCSRGTP